MNARYQCWVCEEPQVDYIDPIGLGAWCQSCLDKATSKAKGEPDE